MICACEKKVHEWPIRRCERLTVGGVRKGRVRLKKN